MQTWRDVPFVALGALFLPMVFRRSLTGAVPGFVKFWGVSLSLADVMLANVSNLATSPTCR